MTSLYIFADESGTMPLNDTDEPFVTTIIAFQGKFPTLASGSRELDKLISILKEQNGMPFAAIVKPFPGYSQAIRTRYSKMITMARAKCLLINKRIQYPDKDCINLHNEVWQNAMLQAIMHILLDHIFSNAIYTEISFVFDQKTMRQNRRKFFESILLNIDVPLREYLYKFKKEYGEGLVTSIISRIQFSRTSISITWSDDPKFPKKYKFGLKLVDRFAREIYRSVKDDSNFLLLLEQRGFKNFHIDITKQIAKPLSEELIDNWRLETGLPEPQL